MMKKYEIGGNTKDVQNQKEPIIEMSKNSKNIKIKTSTKILSNY